MSAALTHALPTPAAASRHRAWFRTFQPNPRAEWRILCLAHAGGSASFFQGWVRHLPKAGELVAVQYPGREERIEEPSPETMETLVAALGQAFVHTSALLDRPYVLFGHSMGAAVAYELCLWLQRHETRLPCQLVLSASEGPGRGKRTRLREATDQVLLTEILRLNPRLAPLLVSPELTAMVLPTLRGDYRLIETYQETPHACTRIEIPVQAWIGREDGELSEADARAWSRITARAFELHAFPGGHFYPSAQFAAMSERLEASLREFPALPPLCLP